MPEGVKVVGLKELRRELKKLEDADEFVDALKEANFQAADRVVQEARRIASSLGPQASKAAGTMRASRAAAKASVKLGDASVPWAAAFDFGVNHDQTRNTSRGLMQGWNGLPERKTGGRLTYPAIANVHDDLIEGYQKALDDILDDAFPD